MDRLKLFLTGLLIASVFSGAAFALGAPAGNVFRHIFLEANNTYDIGTATTTLRQIYVGTASTSNLTVSALGNSTTNCLQISSAGVVSVTGSACASGGSVENIWTTVSPNAYIKATTTIGMIISASSSIPFLDMVMSTSTNATSTNLNVTQFRINSQSFTNLLGTGLINSAGVLTVSAVPNSALSNSTISGVALGGTLASLTATNGTLTFSGAYTGAAAQTVGLNLGNANTWTGGQTFADATSTNLAVTNYASSSSLTVSNLTTLRDATSTNFSVSNSASTSQLVASTRLLVPSKASTTGTVSGDFQIDSTNIKLDVTFASTTVTTRGISALHGFSATIASSTASEDVAIGAMPWRFTVTRVKAKSQMLQSWSTATTTGYTFNIQLGTNLNTRTSLFTSDVNTTLATSGTSTFTSFTTGFNSGGNIALGDELWITTSAASSSLHNLVVYIEGYIRP